MSISTSQLAIDLAALAADLPSTLVIDAVSITGTRSEWQRTDETELTGFSVTAGCEWHGLLADFTAGTPDLNAEVTVDDDAAYINERDLGQDGVTIVLRLRKKL